MEPKNTDNILDYDEDQEDNETPEYDYEEEYI